MDKIFKLINIFQEKLLIIIFFLIFLFLQSPTPGLYGYNKETPDFVFLNYNYYSSLIPKSIKVISEPLRWQNEQCLNTCFLMGGALAAYSVELELRDWLVTNKNDFTTVIGDTGAGLGHPFLLIPLTAATYTYGYINNDEKLKTVGLTSFESAVITAGITEGLKMLFQRHRPRSSSSNKIFDGPALSFSTENDSFPSGHAATAWAIATVVATEYQDNEYIFWTSYGLASFIAISRLFDNAHWLSDVIIGSALGHYIAKEVLSFNKTQSNLTVIPLINSNKEIGLSAQINF